MSLTYVPNSGQNLQQTRDPIRVNWQNIDSTFNVNHAPINSGVTQGMHQAVNFLNQTNAPTAPVTSGAMTMIYSAPSLIAPNQPALYFKGQNSDTTVNGIDFTSSILNTAPTDNTKGWARLPSGIIMKWGWSTVGINSASAVITFATGGNIPDFQFLPVANVSLTCPTDGGNMDKNLFIQLLNNTQIQVYNANKNGGTQKFFYFVIGV